MNKRQLIKVPCDLIKKKLVELRYSMKDLSKITGIPYNTMNSYLNGYSAGIPAKRLNQIMLQIGKWEKQL